VTESCSAVDLGDRLELPPRLRPIKRLSGELRSTDIVNQRFEWSPCSPSSADTRSARSKAPDRIRVPAPFASGDSSRVLARAREDKSVTGLQTALAYDEHRSNRA